MVLEVKGGTPPLLCTSIAAMKFIDRWLVCAYNSAQKMLRSAKRVIIIELGVQWRIVYFWIACP